MKVLMIAIALMMTTMVACNRKSPETKLEEQRMEATEDFQGDVNESKRERNVELNEAEEDYVEEKKD